MTHLQAVTPATGQAAARTSSRWAGVRMTCSRATMTYVENVPMGGLSPPPRIPNLARSCAVRERDLAMSSLRRSLRAFGGEWVTLPSARWDEEDAFDQQFALLVVCGYDDS